MGSAESNHSAFFEYAIEEKIKELGEMITEKSEMLIEEKMLLYCSMKSAQTFNASTAVFCKIFKFDPSTMTNDKIREKERQILRKDLNFLLSDARSRLQNKKQGFAEAMAAAGSTAKPQYVFAEYMKKDYAYIDLMCQAVFCSLSAR